MDQTMGSCRLYNSKHNTPAPHILKPLTQPHSPLLTLNWWPGKTDANRGELSHDPASKSTNPFLPSTIYSAFPPVKTKQKTCFPFMCALNLISSPPQGYHSQKCPTIPHHQNVALEWDVLMSTQRFCYSLLLSKHFLEFNPLQSLLHFSTKIITTTTKGEKDLSECALLRDTDFLSFDSLETNLVRLFSWQCHQNCSSNGHQWPLRL